MALVLTRTFIASTTPPYDIMIWLEGQHPIDQPCEISLSAIFLGQFNKFHQIIGSHQISRALVILDASSFSGHGTNREEPVFELKETRNKYMD